MHSEGGHIYKYKFYYVRELPPYLTGFVQSRTEREWIHVRKNYYTNREITAHLYV